VSAARDVVVVGASGLVGTAVFARLRARAVGTSHTRPNPELVGLDVTDRRAAHELLGRLQPRVVVHCAAWTHVDGCEADPARSRLVNVEGVRNVALAAASIGAHLIFFSSDYVFGGEHGPHRLDEPLAPMNVYGRHKLEAESVVAATVASHAIVRSCNLYGYQATGKNFVMAVLEHARARRPMRIASDQWGSPTLAADLAAATEKLADSALGGVFHLAGPDYVDRPTWARRVTGAFGLDPAFLQPTPTAALGQAAARPLRAGLDSAASERELGFAFRGLSEGLEAVAHDEREARTR
jgi:dTDP-4-dehydrorhamnose reductase